MTTDELYERYAEETDILSNDKSDLVIVYGSRATDDYKDSSDLDVFVVVPGDEWFYHRDHRLIDGIPVETLLMDKNTLMKLLAKEYWNDSKFLESVMLTGEVKRDVNGIHSEILMEIKRLNENSKEKSEFNEGWQEDLDQCLYMYRISSGNEKKRYYCQFVNFLRVIYGYMNNCSDVTEWKFYQLYTNKDKAQRYRLVLPDDKFIDAVIKAVKPDDMDETLESLFPFVGYTDYEKENRYVCLPDHWRRCLSKFDTEKKLIFLGKNINIVEDKLLTESVDADFCYFCLLNYIENDMWYIGPKDRSEFDLVFKSAIDADTSEARIRVLEELLHILDNGYNFDHDDYYL